MRKNIIKIMSMIAIGTLVLSCGVASAQSSTDEPTSTPSSTSTPKESLPSIKGKEITSEDGLYLYGITDSTFTVQVRNSESNEITLPTSYVYRNHSYLITSVESVPKNTEVVTVPDTYTECGISYNSKKSLKKIVLDNDNTIVKFLQKLQEAQVYVEHKGHDEVTVTYLNLDGTVKALEVVDRGSSAKYVGVIEKPFFTFTGWTGADLTNVTENVTVNPVLELTKSETAGKLNLVSEDILKAFGIKGCDITEYFFDLDFKNVTGELDYKVVITSPKGMHVTYTKEEIEVPQGYMGSLRVQLPLADADYDLNVIATDSSEVIYDKHIPFTTTGMKSSHTVDYYFEEVPEALYVGDKFYFNIDYGPTHTNNYVAHCFTGFNNVEAEPQWDETRQMYYVQFTAPGTYKIFSDQPLVNNIVVKEKPGVVIPSTDEPTSSLPPSPVVSEPPSTVNEPTVSPSSTATTQTQSPTGDNSVVALASILVIMSTVVLKKSTSK